MSKEKGTMEDCVSRTMHHVAPHKAGLMALSGGLTLHEVKYRFKLVHDNLEPLGRALAGIRAAAEGGDCKTILELLNGPFEFGHDFKTE